MSNILLATYNYYPYNWGGSEVYVDGLAQFLQKQDHSVKLIAAVPDAAFEQYGVYWSGQHLRICTYTYAGLCIYGAQHALSTTDIYRKYQPEWEEDWLAFFDFIQQEDWHPQRLHLHGFTSVIGLAMLKAFKQNFAGAAIYASYHTPISCPKGTLLRWGTKECTIQTNTTDCTACTWQAKTQWPIWAASLVGALWPARTSSKSPTALQWKMLVGSAVQAFHELSTLVDHWWVFSEQIRQVLLAQGIAPQRITMGRHAAASIFHQHSSATARATEVCIFAFVGRFTAIKGLGTLLQAWQELPIQANRELWLIGDNNDADSEINTLLAKLARRTDIRLLGKKSSEALAELYAQIHALIVPSECVEIGPLVVHEALACGVNIIASDIGGTRELASYYSNGCELFKVRDQAGLRLKIINFKYTNQLSTNLSEFDHYQMIHKWYRKPLNDQY